MIILKRFTHWGYFNNFNLVFSCLNSFLVFLQSVTESKYLSQFPNYYRSEILVANFRNYIFTNGEEVIRIPKKIKIPISIYCRFNYFNGFNLYPNFFGQVPIFWSKYKSIEHVIKLL